MPIAPLDSLRGLPRLPEHRRTRLCCKAAQHLPLWSSQFRKCDDGPAKALAPMRWNPATWRRVAATSANAVLLETAREDEENRHSYLFLHPHRVLRAEGLQDVTRVFEDVERALADGFWIAGFLAYEAGYAFEPAALRPRPELAPCDLPLAWFGVYDAPASMNGASPADADDQERMEQSVPIELRSDCDAKGNAPDAGTYMSKVEEIRRLIAAGDIYQANLTMGMRAEWRRGAQQLFDRTMANQPVAYGALINLGETQIISASPELFFRKNGNQLVVRPMKGTAPRGRDIHEDALHAAWLHSDEKNRAENVMIVDLLRNDLGRVCEAGSVHVSDLFTVECYPSVLQMTSTVRGRMRATTTYYDLFRALFPCGSITGAPKIRAMQIIRALEAETRGISCGTIGFIAPDGRATFNVAIRTLVSREGEVSLRVGSGITYDSQPAAELAECRLKAEFLTRNPEPFHLIETLRWDGTYFLLDLHLERLAESAAYFGFAFDTAAISQCLQKVIAALPEALPHRVRLTLSRQGEVRATFGRVELPAGPASLVLAEAHVCSADPFLRHKTTRRALYDGTLAEARAAGFDDAVFLNERNEVAECCVHNLVIERGGELLTPSLDCGVLPGVFRAHLLRTERRIREAALVLEDLFTADRVWVCNSVSGLRPVSCIKAGLRASNQAPASDCPGGQNGPE